MKLLSPDEVGILLVLTAFACGSLPFSVWLTQAKGLDIRSVGDKNPGATNALRSGGWKIGLAALVLDISKAAAPVGLAYQVFGLRGFWMLIIALAPVIGHAYSPFLNFQGGKALAAVLGVWIGLTIWDIPLVAIASIVAWFLLLRNSGWAVCLTLLGIAIGLRFLHPQGFFFAVLGMQSILLVWKHRYELAKTPHFSIPRFK